MNTPRNPRKIVLKTSQPAAAAKSSGVLWDCLEQRLGRGFAENPRLQGAVLDLSRLFTEDREGGTSGAATANYWDVPRLSDAYLAYFLPLNFLKVLSILEAHAGKIWAKQPERPVVSRWIDLGCGPGTATLAAMAALRASCGKDAPAPKLIIDLVDRDSKALAIAEELVGEVAGKLSLEVEVRTSVSLETLPAGNAGPYDLAFAVNVLNELPAQATAASHDHLSELWELTAGTLLVLEPGHRVSSQRLVRFRERLLKAAAQSAQAAGKAGGARSVLRILGPCPHLSRCPVYRSRHWCHFAEPLVDGRMIDVNLRIFKDPRTWLKYSYLLVQRGPTEGLPIERKIYRAIGDLHMSGPSFFAIDLCQPTAKKVLRLPRRIPIGMQRQLVRGAMIDLSKSQRLQIVSSPVAARAPEKGDPAGPPRREGQRRVERKK